MARYNTDNAEHDSPLIPGKVSFVDISKKVSNEDEPKQTHLQNETRTMGPESGETEDYRTMDERFWLHDMTYLYERSFNELENLFRTRFKQSTVF